MSCTLRVQNLNLRTCSRKERQEKFAEVANGPYIFYSKNLLIVLSFLKTMNSENGKIGTSHVLYFKASNL